MLGRDLPITEDGAVPGGAEGEPTEVYFANVAAALGLTACNC